jgi:hypothetical protein
LQLTPLRRFLDIEVRLETSIQLGIGANLGVLCQKEALEDLVRSYQIAQTRARELTTRRSTSLGIDRCKLVMATPGSID